MILDSLQEAIQSGHSLKVRYFGGSTPGGEREIFPLSIADGKVRARCVVTQQAKTFVIEKMELVEAGVASVIAETFQAPPPTFDTLAEFSAHHSPGLSEIGWVVQPEEGSVSLHRTFKNGKMVKNPDVSLTFEAMTSDSVLDMDTGEFVEMNLRPRERPWILHGKGQTTKTFGDIKKAQLAFLEFAKTLAPQPQK